MSLSNNIFIYFKNNENIVHKVSQQKDLGTTNTSTTGTDQSHLRYINFKTSNRTITRTITQYWQIGKFKFHFRYHCRRLASLVGEGDEGEAN